MNDAIIHFYFEYLQHQSPSDGDYFMDPSVVSYFMHHCVEMEDIEEFVHSAPFPRPSTGNTRGRIFIAVNDCMMPFSSRSSSSSTAQGTHWSLLVLDIQILVHDDKDIPVFLAHHFDSHGSTNTNQLVARKIVEKILAHVYQHRHERATSFTSTAVDIDAKVFFVDASCSKIPQQGNSYDCGVHVLGAAEVLSSTSLSSWSNNNHNIISNRGHENTTSTLISYLVQVQRDDNEQALREYIGSDPARFCADLRKKVASIILQLTQPSIP
jgi:hypothetical protein